MGATPCFQNLSEVVVLNNINQMTVPGNPVDSCINQPVSRALTVCPVLTEAGLT